jgi:hypothetical protein
MPPVLTALNETIAGPFHEGAVPISPTRGRRRRLLLIRTASVIARGIAANMSGFDLRQAQGIQMPTIDIIHLTFFPA